MRVFVLGSSGMLGRYVSKYLTSKGFGVANITRDGLDAATAEPEDLDRLNAVEGDVFINCMGVIKQRDNALDHTFIKVNSAFPYLVANYCEENKLHFIHVTTDCVFDGNWGRYSEGDYHSAEDMYGRSKSFGEPENATIIRTSIIGEELHNKASLLEWVKSNKGFQVNGFTNHTWNGITCLQFAKICRLIIEKDMYWRGVRHIFSPEDTNKLDLVKLISKVFELDITVNPVQTPRPCHRTLRSCHYNTGIEIPDLEEQLIDLKKFRLDKS